MIVVLVDDDDNNRLGSGLYLIVIVIRKTSGKIGMSSYIQNCTKSHRKHLGFL